MGKHGWILSRCLYSLHLFRRAKVADRERDRFFLVADRAEELLTSFLHHETTGKGGSHRVAGTIHDEHGKRRKQVVEQGADRFPEPKLGPGIRRLTQATLRDHGQELPEGLRFCNRLFHPPECTGTEHAEQPMVGTEELLVETRPDLLPVRGREPVDLVFYAPADNLELGKRELLHLAGDGLPEFTLGAGRLHAVDSFAYPPERDLVCSRIGRTVAGNGHQQQVYDLDLPVLVAICASPGAEVPEYGLQFVRSGNREGTDIISRCG